MVLGFGTNAYSAAPHAVEALWVSLSAEGLTVYAEDVPLGSVLREIERVTGIRLRLDDGGADTLTMAFEDVPVEDALRRVLRARNFFIISGPPWSVEQARIFKLPNSSPLRASLESGRIPSGIARHDEVGQTRGEVSRSLESRRRAGLLERFAASAGIGATREAVVDVLQRESNPELIGRALDVVGQDPSSPLDVIMRVAQSNAEPGVRMKALTVLTQRAPHDARVRQTLQDVIAADPAPAVRRAAEKLLQKLP